MHGGLAAGGWLVPKAGRGGRGEARGGEVVRQIGLQAWVVWQTLRGCGTTSLRCGVAAGAPQRMEEETGVVQRLFIGITCPAMTMWP